MAFVVNEDGSALSKDVAKRRNSVLYNHDNNGSHRQKTGDYAANVLDNPGLNCSGVYTDAAGNQIDCGFRCLAGVDMQSLMMSAGSHVEAN